MNSLQRHAELLSEKAQLFIGSNRFLYFCYSWFVLQAGWMALSTKPGIAPDERFHTDAIELYTRNGLTPLISNQEGFYHLRAISRAPYIFYYYLMSLVTRISPFGEVGNLILVRLISVLFVLIGIVYFVRLMRLLKIKPIASNLSVFMLTGTLMFTFISGSVNYDNLQFLVAMASFYYLVVLMKRPGLLVATKLLTLLLFGVLVKHTFLPLAALIGLLALYSLWRGRDEFTKTIKMDWLTHKKPLILLTVMIIALTCLFTERYIGNLLAYQTVYPKCDQVFTVEQCNDSALYRRNKNFTGDDTGRGIIPPVDFSLKWSEHMRQRTYGIFGHKTINEASFVSWLSKAMIVIFLIAAVRTFDKRERIINYIFAISVTYIFILLYVNYGAFLRSEQFGIALQGRYVFPVLPILYMLSNHYTFKLLKNSNILRGVYATVLVIGFAIAALPVYIYKTTPDWHMLQVMENINLLIKQFMQRITDLLPL